MNDKYLERTSACWILAGVVIFVYGLYIGAVGETDIAPIMPIVQGAVLAALGIMGVRFTRLDKMWAGVIVLGVINIVLDLRAYIFTCHTRRLCFHRSVPFLVSAELHT